MRLLSDSHTERDSVPVIYRTDEKIPVGIFSGGLAIDLYNNMEL
jgi:hypothetical protein